MDFDLHDAHSRLVSALADALLFKRLCEVVAAHRTDAEPLAAEGPPGLMEQVARHLAEVERHQAERRSGYFGDRHDGLGPTIGMHLGAR